MAEIIEEPSALSKTIPVSFKINDTDSVATTRLATKKQFNTTDTDAWLSFILDGIDANMTGEFDITMVNVDENPSSIINRTNLPFSAIPFHYKIDASADVEKNQIRHAGRWIGQVIIRLANGDTTTRQFDFAIVGHLLDGKEARLILIEDYNALMATITTSKDELAQYNIDYAALIETVTTQEAARVQAELTRAQTFDALVESEMIAQNVATKLTEKEATYAPRLLSAEQQLEQTNAQVDLLNRGLGETFATLVALQTAYPTGDTKDHIVAATGHRYYWNDTAWADGGIYQAIEIVDKGVTPVKTDFLTSMTSNLIDISKLVDGYIDGVTGAVVYAADSKVSDFIEVIPGETFPTNAGSKTGGYYDANKNFVQSIPWNAPKPYVVPTGLGIKYARAAFTSTQWATARMFKGATLLDYVAYNPNFVLSDKIKLPVANLDGQLAFNVDIKQATFYKATKNIFDKIRVTLEASISHTTGLVVAQVGTDYCASDFMACKSSTVYSKSGSRHVAFYDANKTFVSGIPSGADAWTFATPPNCAFMRVSILKTAPGESLDQYMVYEGSTLPTTYLPPYELTYDEGKKTPLVKKKWVSYGDSLTQMNVWQPIVAERLGLTSVVRGIGSTTATEIGSLAYVTADGTFVDKPIAWGGTTDTPPEGTTTILSSLSNDQRIATIPTDAAIITLKAGTNDLFMSKQITANIDFNDVATFKSAYAVTIKKIQLRCPNARLIAITFPQSNKGTTTNVNGDAPIDYVNAAKEVCALYGIKCIDLFNDCGWNEWNIGNFLSDGVHYLDTGAARAADVITEGMRGLV